MAGRVRATALSARAWDVVLDAGRRRDVTPETWAELRGKGMAKGTLLTSLWQDVATRLGSPESELQIVARSGQTEFRSSLAVIGDLCLVQTRRGRRGTDGPTQEPRVLVQVVERAAVFEAVVKALPPVDDLRADDGSTGEVPLTVPAGELPLDAETDLTSLDPRPTGVPDPQPVGEEPPAQGEWLTTAELAGEGRDESLQPRAEAVRALGSLLGELPEEHEPDEAADLLASVPGIDPRLADLLREIDTEVSMTRSRGRHSVSSADDALDLLSGLAVRHWAVTSRGLVAFRGDAGGLDVVAVAPGDLAREVRHLVAGDLPSPGDLATMWADGS